LINKIGGQVMNIQSSPNPIKRRQFLTKGIVAGSTICFGCSYFLTLAKGQDTQVKKSFRERITENSGMSYEQVFNFAFRDVVIPALIGVSENIGRDKLVEMFKEAADKIWIKKEPQRQFEDNLSQDFWKNVLDIEVLENTEKTRIQKITSCLWAKTFREAGAPELGYAIWCYPDYAMAKSNNMKLERTKSLMLGDDHCYFKYTKET